MKNMSQTLLSHACIGASALLLSIGAAQAADPARSSSPSFGALDVNRDGYIDVKEASPSLEVTGWLSSADKDKDGRLSAAEFSAAQAALGIEQK
ncbi:EF-hand domain-containing protein [Uliginosibacterium sp. H3]|uniref:EF-hand domain-containing protein n=1 Tax=Uliginosibacterium silvisoli TaxID=3114758 RepID=A0ABU6K9R2_9RHOO|nr:EF-hand domain-containing protein [Uliginosibacterium sp. H3]